jgi:hypothetical protein
MFIYSKSEPPPKTDVQVEVFVGASTEPPTKARLKAESLIVRVESTAGPDGLPGFAILNRSCKLHADQNFIDEGDWDVETS